MPKAFPVIDPEAPVSDIMSQSPSITAPLKPPIRTLENTHPKLKVTSCHYDTAIAIFLFRSVCGAVYPS